MKVEAIRTISIYAKTQGVKESREDLESLARSYVKVGASGEALAQQTDQAVKRVVSASDKYRQQTIRLDEVARAQNNANKEIKIANTAFSQGVADPEAYANRIGVIADKFGLATEQAKQFAKVLAQIAAQQATTSKAIDQRMGVKDDFGGASRAKDIEAYGKALDDIRAKYNPLFAATRSYRSELDALNGHLATGALEEKEHTAAVQKAAIAYDQTRQKLEALSSTQAKASATTAAAINQRMNIRDDFGGAQRAKDFEAAAKSADDLRAKYNPLFAAGRQYKATLDEINETRAKGIIGEKEQGAAISRTKNEFAQQVVQLRRTEAAHQAHAKAVGLSSYEMLNFSRQANDVVVSLASGQSPFIVAVQQGSQFLDIIQTTSGSLKGFGTQIVGAFTSMLTPMRLAVGGIAAIGTTMLLTGNQFNESQVEIQRALSGVGRAAQLTKADINSIAKETSSIHGLSVKEATETATVFAATGKMTKDSISAANVLVHDFATALGVDATKAAEKLAEGLTTGIEGVDKLDKSYQFLSSSQRDTLKNLDASIDKTKFQTAAVEMLAARLVKAKDITTVWGQEWTMIGNLASDALRKIGELTAVPTPGKDTQALREKLQGMESQRGRMQDTAGLMGPEAAAKEAAEIAKLTAEIDKLRIALQAIEAIELKTKFEEIGKTALQMAEGFTQAEVKAQALARAAQFLKEAQTSPGVMQSMNPQQQQQVGNAGQAAQLAAQMARQAADEQARHNQEVLKTAASYGGVSTAVALVLAAQKDQLAVAGAVGVQAQMQAQYQATVNAKILEGKTATEAMAIAAGQQAIQQASINSAHATTLVALQGQLSVQQAGHGLQAQEAALAKASAQYYADINNLKQAGLSTSQAEAQAALKYQTALAAVAEQRAAINRAADLTLKNLQLEGQAINASSDAEADRIRGRIKLNDLLEQGVERGKAEAIVQQEIANKASERAKQEEKAAEAAAQAAEAQRQTAIAAENAAAAMAEQAAAAAKAADDLLRAQLAFVPTLAYTMSSGGSAKLFQKDDGSYSQFDPGGYTSTLVDYTQEIEAQRKAAQEAFGGGFTEEVNPMREFIGPSAFPIITPTDEGRAFRQNKINEATVATAMTVQRSYEQIVDDLLSMPRGGDERTGSFMDRLGYPSGLTSEVETERQVTFQLLQRITKLLPTDQQAAAMQKQIDVLQSSPQTLVRDEMIKTLQDAIESLNQSTKDNTSATQAMTDVLSPFYGTDPRATKLGFRSFAGGGIMTADGMLPLRKYDGGGVASTPQLAMFGEGSTPEAYVPVPSGRIPVEIRTPANRNQPMMPRPIIVNNHFHGAVTSEMAGRVKTTAFQQAQSMRRAIG